MNSLDNNITARAIILGKIAKRLLIYRIVFIGIIISLLTFFVSVIITRSPKYWGITLLLLPAIIALIAFVIVIIYDSRLSRYINHAQNEEYELIEGVMIYLDMDRYPEYRTSVNEIMWYNSNHLSSMRYIFTNGDLYKRLNINMYVRLPDYTEISIKINKTLAMEYRCGRKVYLIKWQGENKGIFDEFDFYIPDKDTSDENDTDNRQPEI